MELDTLYYYGFKDKENLGKPKKGIKMLDCIEVFEKDMTKSSETGFSFSINMGERLYHLMVEYATDRELWIQATKNSIKTAREMSRGKGN